MSYLYNDSEAKCLPYLIIKRYVPSGATELTHTICCSVAFLCCHDTKEKKKAFTSLYVLSQQYLPCTNEGCKDQVPGSACLNLSPVPWASAWFCFSVCWFYPGTGGKRKKIASCIPRRRLEAIHFPHTARGKKEETFLRLRCFLGQHSHTVLFFILTRKLCLKL